MPPIWEYAMNGYRRPGRLELRPGDGGAYVGIDLLFTPRRCTTRWSRHPERSDVRSPTSPCSRTIRPARAPTGSTRRSPGAWEGFQPYYRWRTTLRDVDPIDGGAKVSLRIFAAMCSDRMLDPLRRSVRPAVLLLHRASRRLRPDLSLARLRGPGVRFNTTEAGLGDQFGLLGFADDNWVDGTQSFVFAFDADVYREFGYGFTGTAIHEVGHHIGMSHPHDGFDPETGVDFGPRTTSSSPGPATRATR